MTLNYILWYPEPEIFHIDIPGASTIIFYVIGTLALFVYMMYSTVSLNANTAANAKDKEYVSRHVKKYMLPTLLAAAACIGLEFLIIDAKGVNGANFVKTTLFLLAIIIIIDDLLNEYNDEVVKSDKSDNSSHSAAIKRYAIYIIGSLAFGVCSYLFLDCSMLTALELAIVAFVCFYMANELYHWSDIAEATIRVKPSAPRAKEISVTKRIAYFVLAAVAVAYIYLCIIHGFDNGFVPYDWTFDIDFGVRWYGLMFAIGFWIGTEIVARMFKHEGAPERWILYLLIFVIAGTIIGARAGHVFFYEWDVYRQCPGDIIKFWEGGLASHGGTIGVIIAVLAFSKWINHKNPIWTFDRLVVPIALVGALIRLGNLFNSEIYGHATTLPWGFIFTLDGTGYPSHPTQIYESLAYLVLFAILMWMYWKKNAEERPGLILGVFFTYLFTARFFIEFLKNDQVGFEAHMPLNMGQLLSIPFIIAGIALIVNAYRRPRLHLDFPNKFPSEQNKKSLSKA